jgi:hypothetical protein
MARRPYGHTPQRLPSVADDANGLGRRPVLSVRGVASAPADKPPAPLAISTEGLPGTLSQRLETLPDVRLTPQAQADLVVRLAGQELDVIDASGDRLQMLPASDTNRLIGQIRQLAWAKRLRALAERHRRGVLPVDIEPDGYGGNLLVGQQLTFALRPAQPGWLVMVNVAADGTITVLYPVGTFQTVALPAGALWRSPGQRVQPPEGKDLQFMLLFDREPTDLANLVKLARSTDPDHIERVQATLERMVSAESRRFVFGHTEFRTWLAANRK